MRATKHFLVGLFMILYFVVTIPPRLIYFTILCIRTVGGEYMDDGAAVRDVYFLVRKLYK